MVQIFLFALILLIFDREVLNSRSSFVLGVKILSYQVIKYESATHLEFDDFFNPLFESSSKVHLRVVGDLENLQKIGLTEGTECSVDPKSITKISHLESPVSTTFTMLIPHTSAKRVVYNFCTFNGTAWEIQNKYQWNKIQVETPLIHMGLAIFIIIFCIVLSSLLNGLALGLMTLDVTELKVIANAGTEKEKRYGKTILTVRSKGNFLLISLVIGSTLSNAVMTVFIDSFLNNWLTVTLSTVIIVIFCEILPCTIVPHYNLAIGAKTIYITKFFMLITFPVSYPLGKILDRLLGNDFNLYTRERIKELVKITSKFTNIKKLEADMITGALEMSAKKVEDVMTPIHDVYMLSIETYLDYSVISEIIRSGYSRIPIYEMERNNVVKILHVRDLALLDPEDKTSIRLFCQLAKTECIYVDEGSQLDEVFNIFKEGTKGHMAFVCRPDPQIDENNHNVIGLLTLEDIIEELIQAEIVDEFDMIMDNRSKRKRERLRVVGDYLTAFADTFDTHKVFISPQLRLATFQFLAAEIEQFRPDVISPKVLKRMLWLGVIVHLSGKMKTSGAKILFSQEKASEGFVMIIEGRAVITLGPDNLKFECGPFSYFGLLSLDPEASLENKYDYTVEALGEVRILKIPQELYLAARRATELELKGQEASDLSSERYPALFTDQDQEAP